jgi:hypothetical protein
MYTTDRHYWNHTWRVRVIVNPCLRPVQGYREQIYVFRQRFTLIRQWRGGWGGGARGGIFSYSTSKVVGLPVRSGAPVQWNWQELQYSSQQCFGSWSRSRWCGLNPDLDRALMWPGSGSGSHWCGLDPDLDRVGDPDPEAINFTTESLFLHWSW